MPHYCIHYDHCSNPLVQDTIVQLRGVSSVCALLSSAQDDSDLLVRRGLFALGAVVRDRHTHLISSDCAEFHRLRERFGELSARVKLKVTTLLSDVAAHGHMVSARVCHSTCHE